jgi:hypothetical protein
VISWAVSWSSSIKSTFGMTRSLPIPAETGRQHHFFAGANGSFGGEGVPQ